jgi:lysozyme
MNVSNNCIRLIKIIEGCELEAYLCPAGVPTIGIGSTMYPDGKRVKLGDKITEERAEELLMWELETKSASVRSFLDKVVYNQNQFDALVSFAFNLGLGALQGSTLLKKVRKNPNDPTIHDEFMKWIKVRNPKTKVLEKSNGLTRRRKLESALYFKK